MPTELNLTVTTDFLQAARQHYERGLEQLLAGAYDRAATRFQAARAAAAIHAEFAQAKAMADLTKQMQQSMRLQASATQVLHQVAGVQVPVTAGPDRVDVDECGCPHDVDHAARECAIARRQDVDQLDADRGDQPC